MTEGQRRLDRAMQMVANEGLAGWLIADFRWNNPMLGHLLGLHSGILSRRCFLWLPGHGAREPRILISRTDAHTVSGLDVATTAYGGFDEMIAQLRALLPVKGRVAMEYVERGALPTVSVVDAGLIELLRSLGVDVVSSSSLIAALQVWNDQQQALHERAATVVDEARRRALQHCRERLQSGETVTEGMLGRFILSYFDERGFSTDGAPDVGVGSHSADPHYAVEPDGDGAEITMNDVLLIDLSTKVREVEDAPYADSTWMAYTGSQPPEDLLTVFAAVREARDAAIAAVDQTAQAGRTIAGRDVDRVARASIARSGMTNHLIHRTGHSLGTDHVHGMGTNLDDIEFPDDRPLLPGSGFTIEPGLYLPGRFGVRLEVSAMLLADGVRITTERQQELTSLSVN
jgi:Xaa-Pro aminopeptidase